MRKLAVILSVFVCLGVLALAAPTVAMAQLVPCCEGGVKPDKLCNADRDCPGICVGGHRDGRPCDPPGGGGGAPCPDECVGGANDGSKCADDSDCPDGSCSNLGACDSATCTGLCEKKPPKPSPSEPVSTWNLAVSTIDGELAPVACP